MRYPIRKLVATSCIATTLGVGGCKDDGQRGAPPTTAPATTSTSTSRSVGQLVEAENRAVGLMGRFEFDAAAGAFEALVPSHPYPADARTNLAIAVLNRQGEGDSAAAARLLDEVLAADPNHLRARYCRGILYLHGGQPAEALSQFQAVARADPADAYARYHVGQCHAALRNETEALAAYQAAAEFDPLLRSAYYGAFQSLQRLNRPVEAKQQLATFQKLTDHLQARLVEFKYTRMGPRAETTVSPVAGLTEISPPPAGPVFAPASPLPITGTTEFPWPTAVGSITTADIDGDGALDLFLVGGPRNAVLLRRAESFELTTAHPLTDAAGVNAALWGDVDNDGLTDVYLCRGGGGGNQLWRQVKRGEWRDVTASAKAGGPKADAVAGAMFDADHDGDLDVFLANADGPNELLSNNGDGTFRPIARDSGIAGDGRPSRGVLVTDLDNDGDADLLVVKRGPPHEVFANDLLWKYRPAEGFDALQARDVRAAVAADADADGQVELYTASSGSLDAWRRDDAAQWRPAPVAGGVGGEGGTLAVSDLDGDGRPDLLYPTADGWASAALAPGYPPPARDASSGLRTLLVANLDPARGPSLIGLPDGKSPVLWSPGPGRFNFCSVSPSGRSKVADQMRSNASGIGVKLAARVGGRWTAVDTYPNHFGPGQSLQPVVIGLGGRREADFVRFTWPEGLRQTELNLAAATHHRVEETQRQTSSCPVLFAWDGGRYAFVTDVLGVGGIGFAVAPGEYAPPRPWEHLLLPDGSLRPRGGRFHLKLGEPMEEACYLDAASLVAHDLPPGWSMTVDDRMAVSDPQPTGRPVFYRRSMSPARATTDRGEDVTATVTAADGNAAPVGEVDRRFIGRLAREHVLTLTFDRPLDAGPGDPVLIADGWVEYPYSQTAFAAWQAGATYDAPTLEAQDADGNWVVVLKQFGYPAGMPRQMSVPIPRDKLPKGATQLRLRTTQEVYWDRLAVAWAEPCPEAKRTVLPMTSTKLQDVGFASRTNGPQRRPMYDYAGRAPLWDARHQDGFYTAFGAVDELTRAADDAVVIFGPGEEVHAEFDAAVPDAPDGWSRRFVLELAGWCKDRDLYTRDGRTLEPLPRRDEVNSRSEISDLESDGVQQLHGRFNTRYRSGG